MKDLFKAISTILGGLWNESTNNFKLFVVAVITFLMTGLAYLIWYNYIK